MKKLLSLITAAVLSLTAFTSTAYAADEQPQYFASFCRQYSWNSDCSDILTYQELYTHYDGQDEADWVLVYALTNMVCPMLTHAVLGDRVFYQNNVYVPFSFGYAVYDIRQDKFYDFVNCITGETLQGKGRFKDIEKVTSSLNLGVEIGDMNRDGRLSVKDATQVQRCIAGTIDFPDDDDLTAYIPKTEELSYISDVNRDSRRNISDATAIQRKIAGIN